MPVDDVLNTSTSSTELSANAREFFPKTKFSKEKTEGSEVNNGNSSRNKRGNTGAIPKSSSKNSIHTRNDFTQSRNFTRTERHRDEYQSAREFSSLENNNFNHNGATQDRNHVRPKDEYQSFQDIRERPSSENNSRQRAPRPPRQQKKNERYNERENGIKDQKFFKDNQNFFNGGRSSNSENYFNGKSSNDKFFSNNNEGTSSSRNYKPRERWDRQESYESRPRRTDSHKKQPQTPNKLKKSPSVEPSKISQREQLIKDIESNNLECMICCDKIRDHQSTWSCSNCHHILHLNCLRTWITNSKTESGEWRCVACQFLRTVVPRDYLCFCGKQKYPAVNRNDLAHSCGEMCGRTDTCLHPCVLLCHPGPHAVCQSFVQRSCGCGKSTKTFQCSMKETFECEEVCDKTLECGAHKCLEKCHQGSCKPCSEPVEMKCFCGKESKTEICTPDNVGITKYSCDKICDQLLACNNHRCELKCHAQECGRCLLSPEFVKTCPCGRTKVQDDQRQSCLDPIPLCKSQCSKAMKCGHICSSKCHLADCQPCSKTTNVKCRCGRIEEKIACKELLSTDVRCKKKCTKFRTCGKHKCNQNCCIEIEHVCTQQCGRMLECKKHRCQKPCHIGNCSPCQRASFDELRCECGAAVVYPPVPCGTLVPDCSNKCTRRHRCEHPISHLCHSEENCPPCVFLTTKYCFGKHEQRKTVPCNQDSFSCGMPCGKHLKCGRHNCIKKCHQNECEKQTDSCKQPCTVKRECGHNCNAPCHEDSCPEKPCKESVEVTCTCGNLKENKTCEQVAYEQRKMQRAKIAMQMQDGDSMDIQDILVDSSKASTKILECNNDCATLDRNRRLDIAFKVENPNLINYPKFIPNYTEFIRTFYKKEPAFVRMVYEKLTELVKLSKDSKQKSRAYSFPVMNRDKRHAVHDLAAMFGIETQAYDAEPNRNVVATASRESVSLKPRH